IASLELSTAVLGAVRDGVSVTVTMVSAGGTQTTLIGPLTSLWGQGPLHSPLLPSVPIQMAAGDRLVVTTSNNGQPFEDWENVELVMQLTQSPPVVLAQPRRVSACPGGSATLSVVAAGAEGYQWERGTAPIEGATGATLTLSGLDDQDGAQYRCIVRNACGETVSAFGSVLVRTADIGGAGGLEPGDGVLDNNDFIVFITRFFAGDGRGDYGAAGGLPGPDDAFDNNDFIAFINLFFNGCGG
ncbi:MAG: immunoglobulin domain-containing protein, partial [Mycobacteriaceae bacterium]|nr:immunoglobulin domain-containing protein [Mycobacteriaceae bacterium]